MSNSIAPGSSADVNVKVTALTTNPNVPVTYKTIILKKNLVNGVNTLTQEMMSAQNTKYVIKYDYVLGEDITVPDNCMLKFDGGSISNASDNSYTLTYNNTIVEGYKKGCYIDIVCLGKCGNSEIRVSYYGSNDATALNTILSIYKNEELTIIVDDDLTFDADIIIQNNSQQNNTTTFIGLGTRTINTNGHQIKGALNKTKGSEVFPGNVVFDNISFYGGQVVSNLFDCSTLIRLRFTNCNFKNYNIVFLCTNVDNYIMQSIRVHNCFFRNVAAIFICTTACNDVSFTNNIVEISGSLGYFNDACNVVIDKNCIEGCNSSPVAFASNSKNIIISGNYFEANEGSSNGELILERVNGKVVDIKFTNNFLGPNAKNPVPSVIYIESNQNVDSSSVIVVKGNVYYDNTWARPFYSSNFSELSAKRIQDENNNYTISGIGQSLKKGFINIATDGVTVGAIIGEDGYSNYITHPVSDRDLLLSNLTLADGTSLTASDFSIVNKGNFGFMLLCTNASTVLTIKGKVVKCTCQLILNNGVDRIV